MNNEVAAKQKGQGIKVRLRGNKVPAVVCEADSTVVLSTEEAFLGA